MKKSQTMNANQTVNAKNETMNSDQVGEGKLGSKCKPNIEYTHNHGCGHKATQKANTYAIHSQQRTCQC